MSNFNDDRHVVSRRRSTTWTWVTAILVVILIGVGVIYSTGRWGASATHTAGDTPADRTMPGQGANSASVPNAGNR